MPGTELDSAAISALKLALGDIDHLRLVAGEWAELLYTLAWFVGGSLEEVAFLSAAPVAPATEHRVYWLGGKTIGCLVIGAHQGTEGNHDAKLLVSGYVRPVSDIVRLELKDVEFKWPDFGDRRVPELKPTVVVHFADDKLTVDVASRPVEAARKQAVAFIDSLQAAFTTGPK